MNCAPNNIAPNISQRRSRLGLSQNDLAEHLDVSVMTISKWERGIKTPNVARLCELATALGCTPNTLLKGDDPALLVNVLKA